MLPGNFGFTWNAGLLIFLGAFYSVVLVVATTVVIAVFRAWRDAKMKREDSIRWREEFHDLPSHDKRCRHEFTGEFAHRVCDQEFDCRGCETHAKLITVTPRAASVEDTEVFGLRMPAGRFYHRGHTWVREESDGTLAIGLDDLGERLIGKPDSVELPAVGTKLAANGPGWRARKNGMDVRILAPVDGEVVATGSVDDDWLLKVRPENKDLRHLLSAAEARLWLMRELERLQIALTEEGATPSLADGGEPAQDLPQACPKANWPLVWGHLFLEP